MTITETLILMKAVQARIGELSSLRSEVSGTKRYFGTEQKVVEPAYNVVKVDTMIANLRRWLLKADTAVKQANAVTPVNLIADVDELLRPIE